MGNDAATPYLDFEAPAFWADPYPYYARLRRHEPVHHSPAGDWYLTRYADVAQALRDRRLVRESPGGASPLTREARPPMALEKIIAQWMVYRDPPDHTRLRALAAKALMPLLGKGLEARIAAIAGRLFDQLESAGRMEVIADLAHPLPVIVICEIMGVPAADSDRFKSWAHAITAAVDRGRSEDMERCAPAVAALSDYFRELIQARRRQPRDDLMSALIAQTGAGALSEDELLSTSIFLLWAGHETTKNLIGNGLLALLQHPGQLALLRQNPGLIDTAVEELLRYESPVQKIGRWATEDISIGASTVPSGHYLISLLGAANRDPQQYAEPDRLDITRAGNRHMALGHGIHVCLGASLARIEAQVTINTALRRFPKLALATERVEWRRYTAFRSLEALPVVF